MPKINELITDDIAEALARISWNVGEREFEKLSGDKATTDAHLGPIGTAAIIAGTRAIFTALEDLGWSLTRSPLLDETEIVTWQKETFPQATPKSVHAHLREEFKELQTAMGNSDYEDAREQIGDVALLLTALADQLGTTIASCAMDKFQVVKKWEFEMDPVLGYAKHNPF